MFKIKMTWAVLLCAGLFFACGEKDYNIGVENIMPHSVYTTSPVETQISIEELIDDDNLEPDFDFIVKYGLTSDKSATLEATVGTDFSLVANYNKINSKEYKAFPEEYLSFPGTPVNIPAGIDGTKVTFKLLNIENLPVGNYLLPVTIKSVKAGSGYTVHEVKNTAYYVIIKGVKVVKKLTNLSVVAFSDEELGEGGGAKAVLDGDPGSYWHSQYDPDPEHPITSPVPLPHWLILDLSRTMTVTQIETLRRGNGDNKAYEYWMHESTSATVPASDDAGWKKIASGTWDGPDQWNNPSPNNKKTNNFDPPQTGRYLKLVITESYRSVFTAVVSVDVYGYR